MRHLYLLETLQAEAVNRFRIEKLMADISRTVAVLTADIKHEEEVRGVRDLDDPAYPLLARSLRARRDNMLATIASLDELTGRQQRAA